MAKKIEGVTDRVLECARIEFLEKGYNDASLRTIAKKAGTATGSIYTRFGDKAGIFHALVWPIVQEFEQWFFREQEKYFIDIVSKEWNSMLQYTKKKQCEMFDYIYKHFDTFKLLVQCSEGTEFNQFIQRLADIHTEYTIRYLNHIGDDSISSGRISQKLLHMLHSAHYTALFEAVVYDIPLAKAHGYYKQLQQFFNEGWKTLFKFNY